MINTNLKYKQTSIMYCLGAIKIAIIQIHVRIYELKNNIFSTKSSQKVRQALNTAAERLQNSSA